MEERYCAQVFVRTRMTGFYLYMMIFGLLWACMMIPFACFVFDHRAPQTLQKYLQLLDGVRASGWAPFAIGFLALAAGALVVRHLKVRRRWLVIEGRTLRIGQLTFALPVQSPNPAKWDFAVSGVFGTLVALMDDRGRTWRLGLKDLLLAEERYQAPSSETCDFWVGDEAASREVLRRLVPDRMLELDDPAPRSAMDPSSASYRLALSTTSWRTWLPVMVALFPGVCAVSGGAYVLNRVFGVPDRIVAGLTFMAILGLIIGIVVAGNRRFQRRDLRLTLDSQELAVSAGRTRRFAHPFRELRFDMAGYWASTRAGSHYVGPVLLIFPLKGRPLRLGVYDPQLLWCAEVKKVRHIDYALGPPEWKHLIQRLGLFERLALPADESPFED